jgi:mannose-6-phosphate isomerase
VNSPLRFRPYLRPMVWGGRGLADVLGVALPTNEAYGEAWLISDHASHHSASAGDGRTLRQLMSDDPLGLLGEGAAAFPWLVKLIDARDWLSVQVHPDDHSVTRLWPGEGGKTEAWFVLSARPGSRVYAGLKGGVDERALRRALGRGAVADCLHGFEPRAGDCLFLPAGTVHAVGGGVMIAEVQQTSDATFRLFDWGRRDAQGRSRTLHVEQALACIDWTRGSVSPARADGYPQQGDAPAWSVDQSLVRCEYFHLDYVRQSEPFALAGGRMKVVVVLHGEGTARVAGAVEPLKAGDAVLLPASLGETWLHPQGGVLGMLVSSLPAADQRRNGDVQRSRVSSDCERGTPCEF